MFSIVLFQPEIPPNTGNVIRLCANSGSALHLVRPLGFDLSRKAVRRAGLDYEELTRVRLHESFEDCLEALSGARIFSVETGGGRIYSAARFVPGDSFIFGSETAACRHRCSSRFRPINSYAFRCARAIAASISRTQWRSSFTKPGGRTTLTTAKAAP